MKITSRLFEAYLKCPTKIWLLSQEEQYTGNTYADWVESQQPSLPLQSEQGAARPNRWRTSLWLARFDL